MGIIGKLEAGELSVRARRLPWLELQEDSDELAIFRDGRTGLAHWWLWFEGLPLELDARYLDLHRRDAAHHVPLVSLDLVGVPGGLAALVLHDLDGEPGYEAAMGHLLVPSRRGLFEWRWLAATDRPGLREAHLRGPEHDERFRGHVLSLVRSAAREIVAGRDGSGSAVDVLAGPPPLPDAPWSLPATRCSASLPPRFRPTGALQSEGALMDTFARVSFAGSDGVDRLLVQRTPVRLNAGDSEALAAHAERMSASLYERAAATEVTVQRRPDSPPGHIVVVVGARGHLGPLRGALDWWTDAQGTVWSAQILSSAAVPEAELLQDLAQVTTSWRP